MAAKPAEDFEPRHPESNSVTSTEVLTRGPYHRLSDNQFCLNNKLDFGVRAIEIAQKLKKCAKKSLEKSKIILEEKRKTVKQKIAKRHTFTTISSHSRAIISISYLTQSTELSIQFSYLNIYFVSYSKFQF